MPLYDKGLLRPSVLRLALGANDLLSASRNAGLDCQQRIPTSTVLGGDEVTRIFPGVVRSGLSGAALWHDAHVPDSQRVIIEVLRWAASLSARALNYVEAAQLVSSRGVVAGVRARDNESGREFEIRSDVVINATGPSCRSFAAAADRDIPALFRPSLAWNVLFDRRAPSDCALALTPDTPGARTYFLHPWKGRLLAGTGHAPCARPLDSTTPDGATLERFIADLNRVLPDANLDPDAIVRVYAGMLPVRREGGIELTKRAVICDHGRRGGPRGFFSISGIKLTTARCEAAKLLRAAFGAVRSARPERPAAAHTPSVATLSYDWMPDAAAGDWKRELTALIEEESVVHLDDLVFRRSAIGDNPARARKLAPEISALFDWSDERRGDELQRVDGEANQP
jgi:glycerol-3-phosphate dehydrogenase